MKRPNSSIVEKTHLLMRKIMDGCLVLSPLDRKQFIRHTNRMTKRIGQVHITLVGFIHKHDGFLRHIVRNVPMIIQRVLFATKTKATSYT